MTRVKQLLSGATLASQLLFCSCVHVRSDERLASDLYRSLCDVLYREEELTPGDAIIVFPETRPIYSMVSLRLLYSTEAPSLDAYWEDDELDEDHRRRFEPTELPAPRGTSSCRLVKAQGTYQDYAMSNDLLLELSNVVANPYGVQGGEPYGRFARFSLGGRTGAGWYWVAMRPLNGEWAVTRVAPLDISDG